ncbi:hypothetical protein B0H11DRAFT_1253520 [Mycena galericulata]|nr:hypothetical protein B0H11DRAFT_1253520 [Mycena galericulata]
MDDEGSQQDNFTSPSLESGSNATQYAGAFFPHAQHLNISGGTFTSHVTRVAPTIPRDFRMIALGDLDLLHEIRPADRSSVVARKRSGGKLYHVRLDGRISTMTAAVYHEREGEEEWRRELQTYSGKFTGRSTRVVYLLPSSTMNLYPFLDTTTCIRIRPWFIFTLNIGRSWSSWTRWATLIHTESP